MSTTNVADYTFFALQVVASAVDKAQLGTLQMSLLDLLQRKQRVPQLYGGASTLHPSGPLGPSGLSGGSEWSMLVNARGDGLTRNTIAGVFIMYNALDALMKSQMGRMSSWSTALTSLYGEFRMKGQSVSWLRQANVMQRSIVMISIITLMMGFVVYQAYTGGSFTDFGKSVGSTMTRLYRAFENPAIQRLITGGFARLGGGLSKFENHASMEGGAVRDDYMTLFKDFMIYFFSQAAVFTVVGVAAPRAYREGDDVKWGEMIVFITTLFLYFQFAVFLYGSGFFVARGRLIAERARSDALVVRPAAASVPVVVTLLPAGSSPGTIRSPTLRTPVKLD